jgi:hypothetical protein
MANTTRLRQAIGDAMAAATAPAPRKGSASPRLDEEEFKRRFLAQFPDPAFDALAAELDRVADAAWDAYAHERKSPRTTAAGPGFADPDYPLADDWLAAHRAIAAAQARHDAPDGPTRVLVVKRGRRGPNIPAPASCRSCGG